MITGNHQRKVLGPCVHCGRGLTWHLCADCSNPRPERDHPDYAIQNRPRPIRRPVSPAERDLAAIVAVSRLVA